MSTGLHKPYINDTETEQVNKRIKLPNLLNPPSFPSKLKYTKTGNHILKTWGQDKTKTNFDLFRWIKDNT